MNCTINPPEQTAELRKRDEKITKDKAAPLSEYIEALSPEEMRKMPHEIRVHQIELEIQNEEQTIVMIKER